MKKKIKTTLRTCGWCKFFKEHKASRRFSPQGFWIGDGKCCNGIPISGISIGDTCAFWKKK